jgi:[ribosomal protein S18]-alanine N-acetyltransferase
MNVRPMVLADLAAVFAIESMIFDFPWKRSNFSDSLENGYYCWVFMDTNDQLIGYAVCMWVLDEMHILNISVAQHAQGKGQGRAQMMWLMGDCAKRGARVVLLEVRVSNQRALKLYENLQFIEIGRRKNYYPSVAGQREDAIVMQLPLHGSKVFMSCSPPSGKLTP